MITLRLSRDRGTANFGWLDSRHTFSFGHYYDPAQMGFGPLRVINEDRVAPGGGFPTHGHANMEIISVVLGGALEHRDSLGTGSVIRPGDVQRMSAGSGIQHSEFNASNAAPVHFLQIWIQPDRLNIAPGYEQKHFDADARRGRLCLLASGDGRDGALTIRQNADLFGSVLPAGDTVVHAFAPGRRGWVHVARGEIDVNGERLQAGDGAAIENERALRIGAARDAEFLLFDLP
ncbi:MAG TPA: pirin family protein [Patescibacteria group bacterium]|nr:pirin family protein [Patescibacteria group bacterium]